ncbi:YrrS family protein [Alkalibacillus aidingensis]|uniref:YrrS family protein n=1 Tax=Alkalibacillus aidingensis TaxID=2747607 RepID=UPI001660E93F|nr:YrrS family protein [Alkalibacillus aidingensis]
MDHQSPDISRSERYEKRRKSTRTINYLIWLIVLLLLGLIVIWFFGGDDENQDQLNEESAQSEESASDEENSDEEDGDQKTPNEQTEGDQEDSNDQEESAEETGTESTSDSDDENVIRVLEQDWQPIGTEQEEPHVIDLTEESQDRQEMEQAIQYATGLEEDNIIYWWLESGGVPDRIIGTVTDLEQNDIYRVYLNWVEDEGWQPQKVEELYVNDKHPDFDEEELEDDNHGYEE